VDTLQIVDTLQEDCSMTTAVQPPGEADPIMRTAAPVCASNWIANGDGSEARLRACARGERDGQG